MADKKAQTGRKTVRISLSKDYEVRDWPTSSASRTSSCATVLAVGSLAQDVAAHLQRNC